MLTIPAVKHGDFVIKAFKNIVEISGNIDTLTVEHCLKAFFEQANTMILLQNIKAVRVDVKKVAFINSKGIKEFATWVLKQKETPTDKKYTITFQCNPDVEWQKLNFSVLKHLNPDYVQIEN
ncbi:hypothetical protein KAR34_08155 [bacterium]|nr:hypothetical protein [bacterium]